MTKPGLPSVPSLPWDRAAEEEKLFRLVLILIALLFFGLLFTLPKIPVPEKERAQVEEIPPRLAKLIMEKQEPPPPPPPPEPEPEEPEPEEPEPEEPEPEPEEPKPEEPEPEPEPKPEPKPEPTAKERAQAAIAVFDDLSDLRDTSDLADLAGEQKSLGSSATEASVERSLIGTSAIGGSGGVSTSKASSGGGGSGNLAGVATTKVESGIQEEAQLQQAVRERQGSTKRSDENIELVFDRNKGSINALYRRALRQNPTLEGTLVLKLEIQPDGSVTRCEVVSSELDDEGLERKIVLKVRRMNFGSQSVEVWQGTHRLNFFPS